MKKAAQAAPASIDPKAAGYTINPTLAGKYDDQPLFAEKLKQANELLRKAGPPKFPEPKK
jgi:hypothetical protein